MKKYYDNVIDKLSKHYDRLSKKYGTNVRAAQQSSNNTRNKRIKILISEINFKKKISILDFGCGSGYLYNYIFKYKKFKGIYKGIDISEKAINLAKRKYINKKKVSFEKQNVFREKLKKNYDYILINGTFNNHTINNNDWMNDCLRILFRNTNKALIFNNLNYYVDYKVPSLFYIKPEEVFKFCKKNLSNLITLRNDYRIKKNTIPFEFTTFVYKE